MTGLRAAIADLRLEVEAIATGRVLPPDARRPTFLSLQRILQGRDVAPATPGRDRLEETWLRLLECQRSGADPAELPARVLGDATWLLWEKGRRASGLPGVLPAVQALATGRTRLLKRLVEAWLRDYAPEDQAMRHAGNWLADAVTRSPAGAVAVWQRAERRHALFSLSEGPASVARAVLAGSNPPALAELGFDTPARGTGGYMRAVTRHVAALLPARLPAPTGAQVLERALEVFAPDEGLRFDGEPEMLGMIADALTAAWSGSGAKPSEAIRRRVQDVLLFRIGDPRIKPARWARASESARQVVAGWLAQVTLEAFFGVIGQHAGAAGMAHQWRERQRFWSACLKKGWVKEAWLVLGPNVHRAVGRNRTLLGSYGTLEGSNVNNHSALLMRLGNTVFVEWSHNGRLYAWPAGGPGAPSFYRSTYNVEALKAGELGFPPPADRPDLQTLPRPGLVHHSETWRGRVAALLRQRDSHMRIEPGEWS